MKKYLEILEITKPHGIKGEMRAKYFCDDPNEIGDFDTLYLGTEKRPVVIEDYRLNKNMVIFKLVDINTVEQAQALVNKMVYIDRTDVELPDDTWFIQDLIGLEVFDVDSGKRYGKVDDILQNAPTDVYSVKTDDGKQLLFPSIPDVLIDVKINEGKIFIRPLDGLFD